MGKDLATTKTFKKLLNNYSSDKEIIILQGGARSGKTHSILQLLLIIAKNPNNKLVISIVAGTLPQLRRGALRQFIEILGDDYDPNNHNKTDNIFTFGDSIIEFFSADNSGKVRGSERDILFVNEINVGVSKGIFEQLEMRTKKKTIVDYNPETKFYITEEVEKQDNAVLFISTYNDNPFLPQKIINGIERLKETNPEAWRVFGLGLIGQYEGLVFRNTRIADLSKICDQLDKQYGLDFGFDPDPNAFVITAIHNNKIYILKEIVVGELDNQEIADLIKPYCGANVVWCDGAEKKTISILRKIGINARKADKRDRKIRINWLKSHEIIIDKRCKNTIREMESFSRIKDRNGEILPVFQDGNDHCFTADTLITTRYGKKPISKIKKGDEVITRNGIKTVFSAGTTGIKEVYKFTLHFDNSLVILNSTDTHRVITNKGEEEICKLKKGSIVYLHRGLTAKHTINTITKSIFQGTPIGSTGLYGNIITELYSKVYKYIIKMATAKIMKSEISKLLICQNICDTMGKKEQGTTQSFTKTSKKKGKKKLRNGTSQKRDETGTKSITKKQNIYFIGNMVKRLALSVVVSLLRKMQGVYFAVLNVVLRAAGKAELTILRSFVSIAKSRLLKIDTQKQNAVLKYVVRKIEIESLGKRITYNMTVNDKHEYIANGLLVSNCIDSISYSFTPIMLMRGTMRGVNLGGF